MDYKLPSSGMERMMALENFDHLTEKDTVKFVSGSMADLEKARELINKYKLTEKNQHLYQSGVRRHRAGKHRRFHEGQPDERGQHAGAAPKNHLGSERERGFKIWQLMCKRSKSILRVS